MNKENSQIEKNQKDIITNTANPSEQNGWNDIGDLEDEVWKDAAGYEGLYKVSNLGRVKRLKKIRPHNKNRTQTFKEKMLSGSITNAGYHSASLTGNDLIEKRKTIHRLVALAFIPNPLNLPYINHINGIKTDNRVENLEWCTPKYNIQHGISIGLINHNGEHNSNSKLTWETINKIRKDFMSGRVRSIKEIAKEHNIPSGTMDKIIRNISWKDENYGSLENEKIRQKLYKEHRIKMSSHPLKLTSNDILTICELYKTKNTHIKVLQICLVLIKVLYTYTYLEIKKTIL